MKALTSLIALALLTLTSVSSAEARTLPKNAVSRGVAMGQLSPAEVSALRLQEARIKRFKRIALRDGRLNRTERKTLRQMNQKLQRQFTRFSTNRVRRL